MVESLLQHNAFVTAAMLIIVINLASKNSVFITV